MRSAWTILVVIGAVSLLVTGSTLAHTPSAPIKTAPLQTPAPVVAPPRAPDPELDPSGIDTTRRIGGYADQQAGGGADCRTQCHEAYYACLATDDSGQCPPSWTRCLALCPAHSSNF